MRHGFSKWLWGIFLLLAAALVVVNQIGGFMEIGFWSIAVAALAAAMLISSVVSLSFGMIPIPVAVLYYVFQKPLHELHGLPVLGFWTLALVAALACAGIAVLSPGGWAKSRKHGAHKRYTVNIGDNGDKEDCDDNTPVINVSFGGASRYLYAASLEKVRINCQFGGAEVYFENATLSPNGAEVICHCRFGAIELYVPREWKVIDNVSCTLGGLNSDRGFSKDDNAPRLTITGTVAFGGMEINRV